MQVYTLFSKKSSIILKKASKLLFFTILLAAFLVVLKSCYNNSVRTSVSLKDLQGVKISSTDYAYHSYFVDTSHSAFNAGQRLFYKTGSPVSSTARYDYYTFTFLYKKKNPIQIQYSPTLHEIYNTENVLQPSADLKEMLLKLVAAYRQDACKTYGALLVWDEVDKIFPMYATAKITDIYTGLSFKVQRREGETHVDAQPLTAEDTATMKKIYSGRWSWERKGIIVDVQGCRIAASMHGMPHGAGKIDDNNFPGHFCIHFLGSRIHGGGMDLRHHREILKAAGKLPLDDS